MKSRPYNDDDVCPNACRRSATNSLRCVLPWDWHPRLSRAVATATSSILGLAFLAFATARESQLANPSEQVSVRKSQCESLSAKVSPNRSDPTDPAVKDFIHHSAQ
jgi:hypothetical protein